MNIENHFNAAEAYLEMANEKFQAQDYDSALESLVKAYSHTRELMNHVLAVINLQSEVTEPAGDNP